MQERAHQVRLMRTIYEKASRVIVWLGEASEDSDLGMNVARGFLTPYYFSGGKLYWLIIPLATMRPKLFIFARAASSCSPPTFS